MSVRSFSCESGRLRHWPAVAPPLPSPLFPPKEPQGRSRPPAGRVGSVGAERAAAPLWPRLYGLLFRSPRFRPRDFRSPPAGARSRSPRSPPASPAPVRSPPAEAAAAAMGAYLSQPNTVKSSGDGAGLGPRPLHFGFSAMQGWRVSMEVRG